MAGTDRNHPPDRLNASVYLEAGDGGSPRVDFGRHRATVRFSLTILPLLFGRKAGEVRMQRIKQFLCDETAATAIEYAMIGALVSIAILAGARAIGLAIQGRFYGPLASNLS